MIHVPKDILRELLDGIAFVGHPDAAQLSFLFERLEKYKQ